MFYRNLYIIKYFNLNIGLVCIHLKPMQIVYLEQQKYLYQKEPNQMWELQYQAIVINLNLTIIMMVLFYSNIIFYHL